MENSIKSIPLAKDKNKKLSLLLRLDFVTDINGLLINSNSVLIEIYIVSIKSFIIRIDRF